ncbi:hypothetical protein VTH06DRAFT_4007 [Thermothelomyces fergusii]
MSWKRDTVRFRHFYVSYPAEHVIQVTINRPDKLNCIDKATSREIAQVWEELDRDETLWVGIITGTGRAFCTGADLHEWNAMNEAGVVNDMAAPGLAGLPRRDGKKPIIAAVNGICMGGGFGDGGKLRRGGGRIDGRLLPARGQARHRAGGGRTMDLVLTGRTVDAKTLYHWGLVTRLVDAADGAADELLARAALGLAQAMCRNSPDALIVGRTGVRMAWEEGSVEKAVSALEREWYPRLVQGANFREGIRAFVEKRSPEWRNSKL